MLAMKSSTLSSLSVLVVTFLKASPAFLPAAGETGPCAARTRPLNQTAADPTIASVVRHERVMCVFPPITARTCGFKTHFKIAVAQPFRAAPRRFWQA